MKYDIEGEKYLIIVNLTEFRDHADREGTENDMSRIHETLTGIYDFQVLGEITGYVSIQDAKTKIKD